MRPEELKYNQKVVGRYGEIYKYNDTYLATYSSPRIGRRVLRLPETKKLQQGDVEMTVAFPHSVFIQAMSMLKIPKNARIRRD